MPAPQPRPRARSRARPATDPGRLPLGLDDDRDLGRQPAIDLDRDLVRAERLEGFVQIDLVAIDLDPTARERIADVLGRDRAVELAALADLDAHRQCRRRDPGRRDLGISTLAHALVLAARDVM